jgi:hypothetical protein
MLTDGIGEIDVARFEPLLPDRGPARRRVLRQVRPHPLMDSSGSQPTQGTTTVGVISGPSAIS